MRAQNAAAPDVRTPGGNPANAEPDYENRSPDFYGASLAKQAAEMIECESSAPAWLEREQCGIAQLGELAVMFALLQRKALRSYRGLTERSLGIGHV